MIVGQDRAVGQFEAPGRRANCIMRGCSPARRVSARRASRMQQRDECSPRPPARRLDLPGIAAEDEHPIVKLVEAGSHPDMRWLQRLVNEKTGNLARNISVDQVRELGEFLSLTSALSPWRVAVIDSCR